MMNRVYYVVDVLDITDVVFDSSENQSPLDLRYSIDGSQTILHFKDKCHVPYTVSKKGYGPLSLENTKQYLIDNSDDWDEI